MAAGFDMIAFDADDTLWHNEVLFTATQRRFRELLAGYHDPEWIERELYRTEMRNLEIFGYGIKGFGLSMIETAIELSEGRVSGAEIHALLEEVKRMLRAPVEVLDGVRETLELLAQDYRLMVITKGDLFDQETKIARSGLGELFTHLEILSAKTEATYSTIFTKYALTPERFVMVGNSLRSDILPVAALGAHAVHVPYQTTWEHENVPDEQAASAGFHVAQSIREVPQVLRAISHSDGPRTC